MPDSALLCMYVCIRKTLQWYYPSHSVRGEFVLLMASLAISWILQYPKIQMASTLCAGPGCESIKDQAFDWSITKKENSQFIHSFIHSL
jgi:hypothetical protein